ncbi:Os07g0585150 [Oryza sativa Japonica Group]|uniref:Os07g0585150 protein n=1 Tax=Oryza sativa subsp. japonica TaxID=39947 RepID=A0A0P0X8F1_ORYSJ|nr:Os07g0585150 [Oryza sativa Japonica Group]
MRSSRVCRTTSAGVRGLDLKRPFILAPSSAAASAAAAAEAEEASGGARGGEGRGEAAGLLRPPDPKEKQPRNSATGPAAAKPSPTGRTSTHPSSSSPTATARGDAARVRGVRGLARS